MNLNRFLLFSFFVSCFFNLDAMADNVANKTKELTGLQARIKQISRAVNDLKAKKNSLLAELKRLDKQYGKNAAVLKELDNQVKKLSDALVRNQQQMHEKQQQINSQKHELANQVRAAYGMGRNEKLKLLLNQQDPSISGRMMVYHDYVNKVRLKQIASIDKGLQELRDLEEQRIKEAAFLEQKLEKIKQGRVVLSKTKAEHKAVLAKINKKFSSKKKQLSRFKANEKKLKALIVSLQQTVDDFPLQDGNVKNFSKLKGKLGWPVKGKIIKKFGAKRSDSRWDGVLIKAKEGADIRLVARGRVVYADWLRGYGLLTIIDHGKGYMTLYAFNQSLYTTVGEWVEAGTAIATVGQSGGQSEAGLYFGIRKKGKPVNPVKWCRKLRRGNTR